MSARVPSWFSFAVVHFALAVGIVPIITSCSDDGDVSVSVRLVSDYVPEVEAARVLVEVFDGTETFGREPIARVDSPLRLGQPIARGLEVARFNTAHGQRTIVVTLFRADGRVLGGRPLTTQVEDDVQYTVVVSAACESVSCPGNGGVATAIACFAGVCVDPRCSFETPEHCPSDLFCNDDTSCDGADLATCATAVCIHGACIETPSDEECAPTEYCARGEACAPIDMPTMPGGPDDRCGRVCAPEGEACRVGYYSCDESTDPPTVVCSAFAERPENAPCGEGLVCDGRGVCSEYQRDAGLTEDAGDDDASMGDDAGIGDASLAMDAEVAIDASLIIDADTAIDASLAMDAEVAIDASLAIDAAAVDATMAAVDAAPPDACTTRRFYRDADGDGFGDGDVVATACEAPGGYVVDGTDCNDASDSTYPGALDVCDLADNDCDTLIDEGFARVTRWADDDADGYGGARLGEFCTENPPGVGNGDDCNDASDRAYPGASEVCDNLDNDCDGFTDEGLRSVRFADNDGDGYGRTFLGEFCSVGAPGVANSDDCDDTRTIVRPGGTELCDGLDNNCNGTVDEGLRVARYIDADGDGFGAGASVQACASTPGYSTSNTDCDDTRSSIFPGAPELCDNLDNNCVNGVDEGFNGVDITITSAADFAPFQYCRWLRDITVTPSSSLSSLSMPYLTTARNISVSSEWTTAIDLPLLASTSGVFQVQASNLTSLSLPKFATANAGLIVNDTRLTELILPTLVTISTSYASTQIQNNPELRVISLPVLTSISDGMNGGPSYVTGNPKLEVVNIPRLTSLIASLVLSGLDRLHTVNLRAVTTVGGALVFDDLPALSNLDVTSLVTVNSTLTFRRLPLLAELSLPSLFRVSGSFIVDNVPISELVLPSVSVLSSTAYTSTSIRNNAELKLVSLRSATTIAYAYVDTTQLFANNPLLEEVRLPLLATLAQSLQLTGLANLQTVDLGSLQTAYSLSLSNLPSLSTLRLAQMRAVNDFTLNNVALTSVSLSVFDRVATSFSVVNNTNLTALSLPGFTRSPLGFVISANPSMSSIALPSMISTGSFAVTNNPLVTTFAMPSISVGGITTLSGMPLLCSPPTLTCTGGPCSTYDPC